MKKTSDEKYTICKECKYYGLSPLRMLRDRCDKCGCFMRIKTKKIIITISKKNIFKKKQLIILII